METYFNIRFEFDKAKALNTIENQVTSKKSSYVCVADGNILANVHNSLDYREIVTQSLFSICDGSWTTIFLKIIYGINRQPYSGSDIFQDIINMKKYSMAFLGGRNETLVGIKQYLSSINYPLDKTLFMELPFCQVDEFNYDSIGKTLLDKYDIIWVGLGAPKQEIFMNKLKPHLKHGVMIGVGAVFNFYGSSDVKRAPYILRKIHLEFLHRLFTEPKKQIPKFKNYIQTITPIIIEEYQRKNGH